MNPRKRSPSARVFTTEAQREISNCGFRISNLANFVSFATFVVRKSFALSTSVRYPRSSSQNISRKGAKAAKSGQVKRYFSLRSWRLGAINFPTPRPEPVLSNVEVRLSCEPQGIANIFAIFLGALLTLLSAAPAPAQVRQEQAKLTNVVGQVEVLRRGTTNWQPATSGMPMSAGDEIRAGQDSGAQIVMVDGSIVMVFPRSRLQIRELSTETATQTRTSMFHLVVGLVRYIVSQPAVTLVRARQNQFTISTPTAVMAARGTDGILGYAAGAAAAAAPPKPAVPATTGAAAGGPTTLLCLGGVSAFIALPTVPGTIGTGEQIFCQDGQIWQVDAGRLNLLIVLPNSVRAALEAGATPQAVLQIVESLTPVQVIWTPVEQAAYDASPFDLARGPSPTEVAQIAMAALNTNLPTTTIATAQFTPANTIPIQNFEQFASGNTTTGSDVQRVLQTQTVASPSQPSQLQQ